LDYGDRSTKKRSGYLHGFIGSWFKLSQLQQLQEYMRTLRLAETAKVPYFDQRGWAKGFVLYSVSPWCGDLWAETQGGKQLEKRIKWATFPFYSTVDEYDLKEQKSLSSKKLNQLKDLTWIEQLYNIIFLGPPGVGKTHLSIGLGIEALNQGYKVIFTTIGDLIHALKTEEITRKSKTRMKRIREADLVIIDDLMFMTMDKQEANMFFHLINNLYNQTSIILTSNKGPKEWGELLLTKQ
jgi:DNA replication protein DnaC